MTNHNIVMKQWELDPLIIRSWPLIKKYWRYFEMPCVRCGRGIDYEGYRFYWGYQRGELVRISNPWVLDVGHIVNRMDDPRIVNGRWDSGAKYAPAETQPEHAYCNRSAGARDGNRMRGKRRRMTLRTSRQW